MALEIYEESKVYELITDGNIEKQKILKVHNICRYKIRQSHSKSYQYYKFIFGQIYQGFSIHNFCRSNIIQNQKTFNMLSTTNLSQPLPDTSLAHETKSSEIVTNGLPELKRHTRSLKESLPDLPMITRRRLYQRIHQDQKDILINLVKSGYSISEAAKELKLKYSSAKTIMFQYRHNKLVRTHPRALIRPINQPTAGIFFIVNTVEMNLEHEYDYFKVLEESPKNIF